MKTKTITIPTKLADGWKDENGEIVIPSEYIISSLVSAATRVRVPQERDPR